MTKAAYDIYLNTPATGIVHAADCVIEEHQGGPQRLGFRYRPSYLQLSNAFSIDPNTLPLREGEQQFSCNAGLPGFLDDYLPDAWGKKVLTRLAFYRHQQRLNSNSAIDMLSLMGNRRIGALCITPKGEQPQFDLGLSLEHLARAEMAAQHIDDVSFDRMPFDEMSLLYLASSGSGVGGARPKALIADGDQEYIAKFNRSHSDHFNNARVELACLKLAKLAGLNVGEGKVVQGVNSRDLLLLERFDVVENHRAHLISINSLLKNPITQSDHGFHFNYDSIFKILQKFSIAIEQDANQLLRLMLFNRAINNIDDHERNFSLLNSGNGYRLSPAYDLVPLTARGQYHVAGFQYQTNPPKASEISGFGKVFGLSKPQVAECAEHVIAAISQWKHIADEAGVSEQEAELIQGYFNT